MKSNLFNLLKFFIGWPLSIASLFFVFKIIEPKSYLVISKLNSINFFVLLVSIICFLTYFFLRGYIWKEILRNKGYKLNFKNSLYLWAISELKRYTPGNIWSFVGRVLTFQNLGVKKEDSAKSLFFEAEFFIIGALVASIFSIGFLFNALPSFPMEIIAQPLIFFFIFLLIFSFILNQPIRGIFKKISFAFKILPDFKPSENFILIFISFIAVISFGFGVYFVTSSLFYIDPKNFIVLSSFFSLALLLGYLSLITPTGLGVREVIMTFGLSQILPIQTAAFISIFSRIIFIISELIFIFFVWAWDRSKNKFILTIGKFVSDYRKEILLVIFIIIYIVYFTYASFLRYDNFFTGRFDLGNMDQTIWNTLHGRIFQLTDPNGTEIMSRLAFHADFILILISPLYWIWSNPKILLLIQTIIIASGSIFVYLISQNILKNKNLSLLLSSAYLLNPIIQEPNLFDFHPVVLASTFLLIAFYFTLKRKYWTVIIFLFLSGISKEDIWIINALFGLYIIFINKKKLIGSLIFIPSIFIFYYILWIVIPKAVGGQHFAITYFSDFGTSPQTIIKNVILNPIKTLSIIFRKEQLLYLFELFIPFGFLPLLSPLLLIFIFPNLLVNLLSNNSQLHQIYFQYSAEIIPFLFISTIYGIKKLIDHFPKVAPSFFGIFVLFMTIYSAYNFGPLPGAKNPNLNMFTKSLPNRQMIVRYLARIPKRYSVASTNNLGSHLSRRELVYTVPSGLDRADYIAFLIRGYLKDPQSDMEKEMLKNIQNNKKYNLIFKDGEFTVFRKTSL